jgi:hypothetical protein
LDIPRICAGSPISFELLTRRALVPIRNVPHDNGNSPMPPEPQHKPTMLYASAQGEDFYRFSLQIGERTTERVISRDLPASISEDLRLLRWQAVGLVDNGDAFLEIAGKRLGALILREEEREEWRTLLRSTRRFIIRFESGAEALLNLPWELLNLGEGFVLRDAGCHIIREIPSKVHDNIQASHATSSVIHVSLGVDSLLRKRANHIFVESDHRRIYFCRRKR